MKEIRTWKEVETSDGVRGITDYKRDEYEMCLDANVKITKWKLIKVTDARKRFKQKRWLTDAER